MVIWEVKVEFPLSDRRINKRRFKTTFTCVWLFSSLKRSRLIVIRGFKIGLDLRVYGNINQLLQEKLKLLQAVIKSYHIIVKLTWSKTKDVAFCSLKWMAQLLNYLKCLCSSSKNVVYQIITTLYLKRSIFSDSQMINRINRW